MTGVVSVAGADTLGAGSVAVAKSVIQQKFRDYMRDSLRTPRTAQFLQGASPKDGFYTPSESEVQMLTDFLLADPEIAKCISLLSEMYAKSVRDPAAMRNPRVKANC